MLKVANEQITFPVDAFEALLSPPFIEVFEGIFMNIPINVALIKVTNALATFFASALLRRRSR